MMRFECQRKLSRGFVYLLSSICLLLLPAFAPVSHAKTQFEVYQNLQLPYAPVDMQISADGAWLYVLSQQGDLMIYSTTGKLKDTIALGPGVDRIKTGPREGVLFLLNSRDHSLKVVGINIFEEIDIKGSPVKGSSSAPVTIAVFSDFQ